MSFCGVYLIRNKVSGRVYVGSSRDFKQRRYQHFSALRRGAHGSFKLQGAFLKHGEAAFAFEPLLLCSPANLLFYEDRAIAALQAATRGYNVNPTASGPPPTTPEGRAARAVCVRNLWKDPAFRAKQNEARRKVWARPGYKAARNVLFDPVQRRAHVEKALAALRNNPDARRRQGEKMRLLYSDPAVRATHAAATREGLVRARARGVVRPKRGKHSEATKAKLRAAALGRVITPETRVKIGAAKRGKKMAPRRRDKFVAVSGVGPRRAQRPEARAQAVRAARSTPESKARTSAAMLAVWQRPGFKARMSEIHTRRLADPEVRAGLSAGLRRALETGLRERLSVAQKARWADPTKREQIMAARAASKKERQCST